MLTLSEPIKREFELTKSASAAASRSRWREIFISAQRSAMQMGFYAARGVSFRKYRGMRGGGGAGSVQLMG